MICERRVSKNQKKVSSWWYHCKDDVLQAFLQRLKGTVPWGYKSGGAFSLAHYPLGQSTVGALMKLHLL
jgi:hypothetical protein